MNLPPPIPVNRSITYTISRSDLFVSWMTIIFRSRILQGFLLVMVLFNGWTIVSKDFAGKSISTIAAEIAASLVVCLGIMVVSQTAVSLANAYLLKHKGVVGEHTLEITDRGLIERTDYNESLHKYTSLGRFVSTSNYLYVYVTDTNNHMIPRRNLHPAVLAEFEAELRRRAGQA